MEYSTNTIVDRENIETLATTLISALGILGFVTKLWPRRESPSHAELSPYRRAGLLAGLAASCYFIVQSARLGHASLSWVMLASQTGLVLTEGSYEARFISSVNGAVMSAIHLVALYHGDAAITQGLAALSLLSAHLFVPRSADQFIDQKLVDRQESASILERISFTWAASSLGDQCDNLPVLPTSMKAATQAKRYAERRNSAASLTRSLFRHFCQPMIINWVLTVAETAVSIVPQYVTYKLLGYLETQSSSTSHGLYLAMALGGCKFFTAWLGYMSHWFSSCQLHSPTRMILMSLVCEKTLRMPNMMDNKTSKKKDDKSSKAQNDRSSILKGMRRDGAKASKAFTDSHRVPNIVTKLFTTLIFLNNLVGWRVLVPTLSLAFFFMGIDAIIALQHHETEEALNKQTSENSAVISNALLAIRQIKLSAAEDEWMMKAREIRSKELRLRRKHSLLICASKMVSGIVSAVLAGVPLYLCTLRGEKMTAAVAFACLSLLHDLQASLASLPFQVSEWVEGWNGLQRLQGHFAAFEAERTTEAASGDILLTNAAMAWNKDARANGEFELEASLQFPRGKVSVVTGKTGSGKSLLLTAIAGEAALFSGEFSAPVPHVAELGDDYNPEQCNQEMAIVTQSPWMDNRTVKENILFGLPFNEGRYQAAIHCCALEKDIATLPDRDSTMIGAKGIPLSGGQAWRVALARALYSDAKVILLDDILSAVDAEVRQWLVEKALCGPLAQGRTRILATHQAMQCAQQAAMTVTIEDGHAEQTTIEDGHAEQTDQLCSQVPDVTAQDRAPTKGMPQPQAEPKPKSSVTAMLASQNPYATYYWAIGGAKVVFFALVTLAVSTALEYNRTRWLQHWTTRFEMLSAADGYRESDAAYFGGAYLLISTANSIVSAAIIYLSLYLGLRASSPMAEAALRGVFHSPLQWLEKTPRGDIASRLGPDVRKLDGKLLEDILEALRSGMGVLIILFTSASISSYQTIATLLLLFLYYKITYRMLPVSKKLKILSDKGTGAFYQRMQDLEKINALLTLRTFNMCNYFLYDIYAHLDTRTRYMWYLTLSGQMMNFQLAAVGALFVTSIAVGAVATQADAGSTGVALLFANQFSKIMSELLQRLVDVEGDMVSVGRVHQYAGLPAERLDGEDLPESWPLRGELEVSGLTASPEPDFEQCLLKDVSFSVKPGERVGIVGRTGAGKSSLILALTRHLHMKGSITIDGVDLTTVNVKELRRKLSAISQDPYLFGATLREVVDPAGAHTDVEIQNILSAVGFSIKQKRSETQDNPSTATTGVSTESESNASNAVKLDFEVGHGGMKLSQGQRQLLCLAKVLLADRRMIIIDEATSALDAGADAAVQRALRSAAGGKATLLVVAHRLATVADFDKLLVVENGRLEESGRPAELYQKGGLFTDLVNSSVDKDELLKMFK